MEDKLKSSNGRIKLIVTDGVFSMDGNVAPLDKICDLADKYNALTFVDDCHATGFFGKTGRLEIRFLKQNTNILLFFVLLFPSIRGTEEFFNIMGRVDIINSTLGKALGGAAGGYTVGSRELIDLLKQRSRPYLFSNSLPPAIVASACKVIDLLMQSSEYPQRVQSNTERFRTKMVAAGFNIGGAEHAICPVMLGEARLASVFADEMLSKIFFFFR